MAVGNGRACDDTVGFAPVRSTAQASAWLALGFITMPLLAGCSALGGISGAIAGASTGAVTANPIVGYTVAVGVNAGVDQLQKYVARVRQNAEQDAIVDAVGEMDVGTTRPWKIVHQIPMFDDEHGEMEVTRLIQTPLADCKEVLFTIDQGKQPHLHQTLYVTSACLDSQGWKWASAEPSINRWGFFQHITH
ncbi:hypothetical protein [Acidisoma cladoniae]|jgi:hypothetical protein|uniref:hypothetical protein n=1 Tax=Acidisoma cladoniae TaxID=3040935 RepID=UPI00254D4E3E|nr:hypothetical protein [Acidisoma sp. PAMC 29798]